MMDIKELWESFKDALVKHGFCAENGRLENHEGKLVAIGASKADIWVDIFTESMGRVWLPVTDDPDGPWRYYRIPGTRSDYSTELTEEILMRAAKMLGIEDDIDSYNLRTASELLDDDMLDI